MSRRCCFALDLVADAALIAEYERAHATGNGRAEVTAAIRAHGSSTWRYGVPATGCS
ncbi:L-rhamnose mutarotase [Croceibacterium ferulae]|uniref:L-rhamnose mutarotase n=1 Tax=Croceibacterium ferulae TaxID=1854641 RepID=UPI0011AEB309|nr:L-rhamnose mutarotase [Croceibacterium ferulae]